MRTLLELLVLLALMVAVLAGLFFGSLAIAPEPSATPSPSASVLVVP